MRPVKVTDSAGESTGGSLNPVKVSDPTNGVNQGTVVVAERVPSFDNIPVRPPSLDNRPVSPVIVFAPSVAAPVGGLPTAHLVSSRGMEILNDPALKGLVVRQVTQVDE